MDNRGHLARAVQHEALGRSRGRHRAGQRRPQLPRAGTRTPRTQTARRPTRRPLASRPGQARPSHRPLAPHRPPARAQSVTRSQHSQSIGGRRSCATAQGKARPSRTFAFRQSSTTIALPRQGGEGAKVDPRALKRACEPRPCSPAARVVTGQGSPASTRLELKPRTGEQHLPQPSEPAHPVEGIAARQELGDLPGAPDAAVPRLGRSQR